MTEYLDDGFEKPEMEEFTKNLSKEYAEKIIKDKGKENYEENLKKIKETIALQLEEHFSIPKVISNFLNEVPFYYDNSKIWWVWDKNETVWKMIDETDILVMFTTTYNVTGIHKTRLQNEIVSYLKIEARKKKPIIPPANFVQFGKTIYNIETNETFQSSPEYFFTNSLPFTPAVSDECPTFDKLFDSWVGRENRELMYEIISYCAYRDYPIHHLFCFVGSGSNGKSKFLSIIQKFLGINNCCSTSLDTLMNSRFESATLYKKLACMMGETNFSTMSRTEMLKKLTGQDLVSFEFKNKMPIADYNYSKILISTNTLPETTDRTDGFYRRWVIIDFSKKFSGDFDILKSIPELEYNNLSRRVLNILPNLLSYMRFTNVGTLDARKKIYEDKSNPLPKFLELNVSSDPDSAIPKWLFNERFNIYLRQNNLRSLSDIEIGTKMKALDYTDRKVVNDDGKSWRVWDSIKWKEDNLNINNDNI